ncbi:amino acid ABC transporter permease [Rugosimonospora africana]|uniref:Amino acid ABC transporter permease n=1 Tax=Rugosimonospora africana TaxID=556532 RepID=A0A8J3VTA7_9ACTN|nr:amino acid ABC transporter permease [Rugosimonospora africana]GIH17456.1 amino acid ABC transporter permease [Rugosimonospora africana]
MNALTGHLSELGHGVVTTVELTVVTTIAALLIGIIVAILRITPVPMLRGIGLVYVEVLQNLPLLALLVLFVFALPQIGITFPLFTSAAIVIACYEGAYMAEAIRAGINTVAVGQAEAARAIGLTFSQSLRHVILPQALRAVIQPIGNICIALLMNTSLAAAVGVVELTQAANNVNLVEAQPIEVFTGAGIAYMLMALIIGFTTGRLERKLAIVR